MSMSDCPKCWDTDCNCGFNFLHYQDPGQLRERAELLQDVAAFIEEFGSLGYPVSYEIRTANLEKFKRWRIERHRG